MSDEVAEVLRTRREDRPKGVLTVRSRQTPRATGSDPQDWARFFLRHHPDAAVLVAGSSAAGKTSLLTAWAALDWRQLTRERRGFDMIIENLQVLETRSHSFPPESTPSERELQLYKEELKRIRSQQKDEDRQSREVRKKASAYLDEAVALAHPIALRLLGWLHVSGSFTLERVFEVFGSSASTFEGVARLHFIGTLKFDDGVLTITSLGSRVLKEFGLIDSGEAEGSEPPASS